MKLSLAAISITLALGVGACSPSEQAVKTGAVVAEAVTQTQLQQFADGLQVRYRVVSNRPDAQCIKDKGEGRCFQAEIDLTAGADFQSSDFAIYFSQMRPVQAVEGNEFVIEHVKGDLHRIKPGSAFAGFKAGETRTIKFRGELWQLAETDAMPNYYITSGKLAPVVIASTKLAIEPETGLELRPYVEAFVDADKQYKRTDTDKLPWATSSVLFGNNKAGFAEPALVANRIIPAPLSQRLEPELGSVDLSRGLALAAGDVDVSAALSRLERLGVKQSADGIKLSLVSDKSLAADEYQLQIRPEVISVTAGGASGASHALSTLAALVQVGSPVVTAQSISDKPRYDFRGMHVDVSRNFHSKAFILDVIDQMAAYKLNKLHLHMGDDEGWRLEIDGLPELTDIGSKRCHDLDENTCLLPQLGSGPDADATVNGFYSKADYIEILKYAAARHIQVIPSMDMPGHSRAAVKAMEARYRTFAAAGDMKAAEEYRLIDPNDKTIYSSIQYYDDNTLNVCMESTYHFVDKVITEIARLHESAGVPLTRYHIGADETAGAWLESPKCAEFLASNDKGVKDKSELGPYFIERVANMLTARGIEPAGWSDGMSHTRPERMPAMNQSNIWDLVAHKGHHRAHNQANLGWEVVLSNPEVLYFDFPYEADPKEHGYYWASRGTNSEKVFGFMPGNLPANAEQWLDIENNPFEADDRVLKDDKGNVTSEPLKEGKAFVGIQGQLWSETIRSDEQAEYMIFPRLLMLAERAWHKPSWEVAYRHEGMVYNQTSGTFTAELRAAQAADWQLMANTLGQKELAKLDLAGIHYRVPTVGARIADGKLEANIAFPGLGIEYREAGGQWQAYQAPVAVSKLPVEVRAIAADGKRKGRTLEVK
ncbi:carbohydate-binding domain-containing protein [Shewanella sp. JM162201]|uniref:beta-N-acetylhexosaminidase n=1 Tax=Shewanella jiangmenensis TaxID=2837387 RepID=A0ABS5UZC1_9GAMM|nr:family 20 glycosylhydrolase [Shewanella jiangmenensis]MBT1443500.1 carbohydate-binding domain-containing protein [Shewanella jiangmenensis]